MVHVKTIYDLQIRAFPVKIVDERTGEEKTDIIVLDKQRLQAAQMVGQSSKELIERIYVRCGYRVQEIGRAHKATVELRLDNMYAELTGRKDVPMDQPWNLSEGDAGGKR